MQCKKRLSDRTFDVFGVVIAKENTYQLKLDSLDDFNSDTKITGKWNFSFTADDSDLIAVTKTVPVAQEFTVADGVTVTLEELTLIILKLSTEDMVTHLPEVLIIFMDVHN